MLQLACVRALEDSRVDWKYSSFDFGLFQSSTFGLYLRQTILNLFLCLSLNPSIHPQRDHMGSLRVGTPLVVWLHFVWRKMHYETNTMICQISTLFRWRASENGKCNLWVRECDWGVWRRENDVCESVSKSEGVWGVCERVMCVCVYKWVWESGGACERVSLSCVCVWTRMRVCVRESVWVRCVWKWT